MLKRSLIFLSFLVITGCSEPSPEEQSRQAYAKADLVTLENANSYQIPRAYIGRISTNQFTPLSFEYNGTLDHLLVDNGDHVKKGDTLAILNTQLIEIKLAELNAQLAQNSAQVTLNKSNLKRINKLKEDNYASAQTYDELVAEQVILEATKQQLSANINALAYQLDRSKLIAPFDGVISNRQLAQGANVQSGAPVLQIIKQNDQEVKVGISTELASSLILGQPVDVEIGSQLHQGTILRIGKQINPSNRTVNLRVALNNNVNTYNDQLAKVIINQTINKPGFWVPMSALSDGVRGQWNLLIANPKSQQYQLELVAVTVEFTTQTHAFITGVNSQSLVYVAQGVHKFVPNQIVEKHISLLAGNKS